MRSSWGYRGISGDLGTLIELVAVCWASATGNALPVRAKHNQPTLHAALAGLCATGCPFDSHETVDRGRQRYVRCGWRS